MTGSRPPPKRFLHIAQSGASSFKWENPLLSLRSSSSFLRLLPHLIITSISPFIFPSITCFRRQMWPIQLAFRFLVSCRIFLCSLTLSNTSSFLTWLVQLISILLQHHISTCYMTRPSLYPLYYHPNNFRWTDYITKICIMHFSPVSCYSLPLRPKYDCWLKERLRKVLQKIYISQAINKSFILYYFNII